MKIELLYFDGCPSHEAFLPRLRELLAQADVDLPVRQRRVEADAAAQSERFLAHRRCASTAKTSTRAPGSAATTA